jgi:hypothetical protein
MATELSGRARPTRASKQVPIVDDDEAAIVRGATGEKMGLGCQVAWRPGCCVCCNF